MKYSLEKVIGASVGLAIVLWIGWLLADRMYFEPADELRASIATLGDESSRLNDEIDKWIPTRQRLRSFGQTLLSREFDQTEHRLRTTLQEIGQKVGLGDIRVSSTPPKAVRTPLAETRRLPRAYRPLTGANDFAIIRGTFAGAGTLEQATLALAYLEAQPWLHRLERVTLEPRGREREVFELDVGFAVVFAPDLCPADAAMPTIVDPAEAARLVVREVAQRNVFVAPVAAPTAEIVEAKPPPPPPVPESPPYDRWKVTGLLERRSSGETMDVEAWVLNLDSGEQRVLRPGDAVLGFTLEWISGECGLFTFEAARVVIHQGQTLADHVPAESVDCPGIDGVPLEAGARTGEGEG